MLRLVSSEDVLDRSLVLRVDLNIPIYLGQIVDDSKLKEISDSVNFLSDLSKRLVIISHLGRPSGVDHSLTLKPIADRLSSICGRDIVFLSHDIYESGNIPMDGCFMLENVRFHKGEYQNDPLFSKTLSSFGEVYINNAFPVSHRAHASVVGITNYLKSFAGFDMAREYDLLSSIETDEAFFIIGGGKVNTKIPIVSKLVHSCKSIFLGGILGNYAVMYRNGIHIDFESDFMDIFSNHNCNIILPIDFIIKSNEKYHVIEAIEVNSHEICKDIVDIGPKTINLVSDIIKSSNNVICNGPVGIYEIKESSIGTISILQCMSSMTKNKSITSVVGGGDMIAAVNKALLHNSDFTLTSVSGGAMMEFLIYGIIPGIVPLMD